MTTSDSGNGRDPIDPVFASLFRPDDPRPADSYDEEPLFESIVDPVIDPRDEPDPGEAPGPPDAVEPADEVAVQAQHDEPGPLAVPDAPAAPPEPAPVPHDPVADTGRLFRSQGVAGHDRAVLAISSDHSGRLRTLDRRQEADPVPVLDDAGPVPVEPLDGSAASQEVVMDSSRRTRRRRTGTDSETARHRSRGITGGAVYLIVIGVTVLVAFANALLSDGDLGWPTGLALLVSSVYAALTVRREDDFAAMIVPPIAFLVAAMTAGQLFLGSAEGSVLNRAVVVFFALADNWFWIIGATVASLAIVLVRRRRG